MFRLCKPADPLIPWTLVLRLIWMLETGLRAAVHVYIFHLFCNWVLHSLNPLSN
jgi:hypothetical protein